MVKAPEVVAGKGLRSLEEALQRLEDPKATTMGLAALYKQLPDIFAKSFQTMKRATTEGEKQKIQEGMDQALSASQKTKLYQSMSRQERTVFDQAIGEQKRRLESFTLQNGGKGQQGKPK
jgi:hypothetical protein